MVYARCFFIVTTIIISIPTPKYLLQLPLTTPYKPIIIKSLSKSTPPSIFNHFHSSPFQTTNPKSQNQTNKIKEQNRGRKRRARSKN
jgi:hypothetical protein